jgi:transcriptional regulator with XRE-family HTH domain
MQRLTLKDARRRRRLDQVTLAKRSGVNQSTVSRLEKGRIAKPTEDTVKALERALRLPSGSLVFGSQEAHA